MDVRAGSTSWKAERAMDATEETDQGENQEGRGTEALVAIGASENSRRRIWFPFSSPFFSFLSVLRGTNHGWLEDGMLLQHMIAQQIPLKLHSKFVVVKLNPWSRRSIEGRIDVQGSGHFRLSGRKTSR